HCRGWFGFFLVGGMHRDAVPLTPVPSAAGRAAGPLPTLAPPLSMVVAGQHRQLVVCVVSDLAPSSGHAVWISGGNSSALQSFAYGASQEDGGTICTVSLTAGRGEPVGDAPPRHGPTAALEVTWRQQGACGRCHPIPAVAAPPAHALAALLVAIRVVLLKIALFDALLTSILLAQS
uniref:Ig-like domain-containing protein n=1 Tax=Strix occidentalis caurina TaxID=311401 RepID=A0A8D0KZI8_STROC